MTSRNILCGICEVQHITKDADQWCPECDEGLCFECDNHHKVSKATRNHGVITIENYHKLPSYFTDRQKSNTIFVVCRNAIWTAGFVMVLTEICIFHIMIFTVITDFRTHN
jgi:hypothetical protein